jgi:hypothetical protein
MRSLPSRSPCRLANDDLVAPLRSSVHDYGKPGTTTFAYSMLLVALQRSAFGSHQSETLITPRRRAYLDMVYESHGVPPPDLSTNRSD